MAAEPRFWEVDAARGVAIIMVVVYHLVYDLDNFVGFAVQSTVGFWGFFADASASAFAFLVGLSLTLSLRRAPGARADRGDAGRSVFGKYLRRGLKIFGYGMAITAVFILLDLGNVVFGMLHLIGASIVLAYPFLRLRLANLALGAVVIAVGIYVGSMGLSLPGAVGVLLSPLGVSPEGLFMPDYRPLLPWFGVVLVGAGAGNLFYAGRKSARTTPALSRPLGFLGRNTLFIYLVHQPVLIGLLSVLGLASF